ncbi:MAG: nucleotidyltransferase family protein [Oscillospiraceae bacterium]|nr:nucleotidyltransferase family protein [Oscillospiraceae bacterium]
MNNVTSEYLIALMNAAINAGAPPKVPDGMDLHELFELAQFHSVANIVLYMLEKTGADIPKDTAALFAQERDKAILADITFQMDYEELSAAFREHGLRFLPLKGILMKQHYPQSDYRTMSDIDILIDDENAQKVRSVMEELGYETVEYNLGVHDVYHKLPVTRIEIHRELFGADGREYAAIFTDPWAMCCTSGDALQFTDEAFFIFLLAHGMKHYELGGTGIRTFMDIHLFIQHLGKHLDLKRIYETFETVGQRKLCESFIALSEMWFGGNTRTEALTEMERYILLGGTYGTFSNQVETAIKEKGKAGYVWNKLFPDLITMQHHYPMLKKAPVLLPVFWIVRIATKPFINRRQNAEKIKALLKK